MIDYVKLRQMNIERNNEILDSLMQEVRATVTEGGGEKENMVESKKKRKRNEEVVIERRVSTRSSLGNTSEKPAFYALDDKYDELDEGKSEIKKSKKNRKILPQSKFICEPLIASMLLGTTIV